MGAPAGVPRGARRPSHVAYYVALAGILSLLVMLCLYFFYYFIKKVKELSTVDTQYLQTSSCRPPPAPAPAPATYPVQPVVRDSATAMARLCRQVPAPAKGDTVFPTSTSPAALRASTGGGDTGGDDTGGGEPAPAAPSGPADSISKAPAPPVVPAVTLDVPVR